MPTPLMRTIVLFFAIVCFVAVRVHAEQWLVGDFSGRDPSNGFPNDWKPLQFPNIDRYTRYSLVRDNHGNVVAMAESDNAASGMIRELRFDPDQYPLIRWQWKIEKVLERGDITRKEGDDYAARIYVAFAFDPQTAGVWQRVRHKTAGLVIGKELPGSALNYIWASRGPVGTIVSNPYSEETKMVVLRSGNASAGRWLAEQRNIVEDYQRAFGRQPPHVIGIGLMTDTDNTQEKATAYYGDIVLASP